MPCRSRTMVLLSSDGTAAEMSSAEAVFAAALADAFDSLRISPAGPRDFIPPVPQYRGWPGVLDWSNRQVRWLDAHKS